MDKVIRKSYPHLFYSRTLTKNDWALDGCCGSNLSGDINVFHRNSLKPIRKYIFTFGEGTKLPNTHIGIVSLWFESCNHGCRQFTFKDVNYVPGATSNILSEFVLKSYGYNIVDSACGNYKYVFNKRDILQFIAVAINGSYYVRANTLEQRQIRCDTIKC